MSELQCGLIALTWFQSGLLCSLGYLRSWQTASQRLMVTIPVSKEKFPWLQVILL